MAQRGIFTASQLAPHLAGYGVRLSDSQIWRLVTGRPERLNLWVLVVLCEILDCTPRAGKAHVHAAVSGLAHRDRGEAAAAAAVAIGAAGALAARAAERGPAARSRPPQLRGLAALVADPNGPRAPVTALADRPAGLTIEALLGPQLIAGPADCPAALIALPAGLARVGIAVDGGAADLALAPADTAGPHRRPGRRPPQSRRA